MPEAKSPQTASSLRYTVVYVHGIGNKPRPLGLKQQWDKALFGMDMGERTRMAYWADIRYTQPLPDDAVEIRALALEGPYRPLSDEELISSARAPVPEQARDFAEKLGKRLLARSRRAGGMQVREVEAQLLPDWIRRQATEWITRKLIEDVSAYFYDATQREAMRSRLRQLLVRTTVPYIVVGHSMGTIISYDVLRELEDTDIRVALWVTLGSPLGIEEVQDHLQSPLDVPRQVPSWKNFSDVLDPVAFDKELAGDFEPPGTIKDSIVINRDSLRLRGFNPHSATGYLATGAVQRAVREVVGAEFAQPVRDFEIAPDVAAEMQELNVGRIPVLIELNKNLPGEQLLKKGQTVKALLEEITEKSESAEIDVLRFYVAARLTQNEIDRLLDKRKDLAIHRVWKNAPKQATLDRSIHTVQATTAQRGYDATGKGIAWAVLDTGINAAHPHFVTHNNIAAQWDCARIGAPRPGAAADSHGHGTHVAGIIAGVERVAAGQDPRYRGMAPEAKLHIYKVLDDDGRGQDSWILKALDHIAQVNESSTELVIHGINLSLGGPFDPEVYACGHSVLCRELRRLWRQGVIVCIAAGNEGLLMIQTAMGMRGLNLDLSIGDPANLDEAIAVGSVHKDRPHIYGVSYFSSRGPTADGRAKPDVVAPGERIRSCSAQFILADPSTHYLEMSGTSMACPHVSGILAGFLSVRREFIGYPEKVREILLRHCTDLRRDHYIQGAGLPNLTRMLAET